MKIGLINSNLHFACTELEQNHELIDKVQLELLCLCAPKVRMRKGVDIYCLVLFTKISLTTTAYIMSHIRPEYLPLIIAYNSSSISRTLVLPLNIYTHATRALASSTHVLLHPVTKLIPTPEETKMDTFSYQCPFTSMRTCDHCCRNDVNTQH